MAAEHPGVDAIDGDVQLHRKEGAETGCVENARHADDPLLREAADLMGALGHGVEGVGHGHEDGVGRMRHDLVDDARDDLHVGEQKVVAGPFRACGRCRR